ncbi:Thiol-disulfide isomerase or thioredoxin [Actinopolyspora xinjiangensis]|uniref:Thiol-disulfide isomerase or thioredoxin n=1 Tax=Actinopolyspora xinjiangensis TaxID=405564 RepID=A0A1H0X258_9ACTN|nr:TlpA disulfide reductase family protein [Actinopolyspora xinjiangensis]SDP97047.1 Thiol-disulfide isomerase or thioredoxin [Actinopolyspora xinjiangensis]
MASERSKRSRYGNEIRWTLIVLVVAGLAVVALWPRDRTPTRPESPAPTGTTRTSGDLASLRADAELPGCGPTGNGEPPSRLRGATGSCMGDGSRADLGEMTASGTTLINVWASWCPPCRKELPALQRYAERQDEVRVIGVQVRSDPASGLRLLRELGVRLPTVHDSTGRVSRALRVPKPLPASYLVTPSGEIERMPVEVFESADEVASAVQRKLEAR